MIQIRKRPKTYLKEGAQTKITPGIKKLAEKIDGEGLEFVFNLLAFLARHLRGLDFSSEKYQTYLKKYHLRKTADEIIADRLAPSCGDIALAFAAICRAKGIPAKIIEGALYKFLEDPSDKHISTHVFVEIFIDRQSYLVDPGRKLVGIDKTLQDLFTPYAGWEPCWEGLDYWEMGIFNHEDLRKRSLEFKRRWKKKQKR